MLLYWRPQNQFIIFLVFFLLGLDWKSHTGQNQNSSIKVFVLFLQQHLKLLFFRPELSLLLLLFLLIAVLLGQVHVNQLIFTHQFTPVCLAATVALLAASVGVLAIVTVLLLLLLTVLLLGPMLLSLLPKQFTNMFSAILQFCGRKLFC